MTHIYLTFIECDGDRFLAHIFAVKDDAEAHAEQFNKSAAEKGGTCRQVVETWEVE